MYYLYTHMAAHKKKVDLSGVFIFVHIYKVFLCLFKSSAICI